MSGRTPKRKRLSPREKKDISLRKDQRSDWWEYGYSKGVRSKPRACGLRIARRAGKVGIREDIDAAEGRFRVKMKKRWKKYPGVTLAEDIAAKKARQISSYGRKKGGRVMLPLGTENDD